MWSPEELAAEEVEVLDDIVKKLLERKDKWRARSRYVISYMREVAGKRKEDYARNLRMQEEKRPRLKKKLKMARKLLELGVGRELVSKLTGFSVTKIRCLRKHWGLERGRGIGITGDFLMEVQKMYEERDRDLLSTAKMLGCSVGDVVLLLRMWEEKYGGDCGLEEAQEFAKKRTKKKLMEEGLKRAGDEVIAGLLKK